MWRAETEEFSSNTVKYRVLDDARLSYVDVIKLWCDDDSFREFFAEVLRDAPFGAYRWETPLVTQETLDQEFEFVLVDCPPLARQADRQAFGKYLDEAVPDELAIAFENLGRDATLVVPCPRRDLGADGLNHFAHLASFVRKANEEQVDDFWQLVGQTMSQHIGDKPIWLSTAGMGVAWLHVRLDQRPKYYTHGPYREERP